jgi:hypothetical protein
LGRYVTDRLNEDFNTDINIGRVGLQFNGDVELKEVLIRDHHKDTLISVAELNTSIISFKNVINNKLNFGDIDLETLYFNLKTYKGEADTNLDVFVASFDDDQPRTEPSDFLFSSSDISIDGGNFVIRDENLDNPVTLDLRDIYANVTNFVIAGPEVRTRINKLSLLTKRGVRLKNLMADFEYTLDHMDFKNLSVATEESDLRGDLKFIYKREDLKDFTEKVRIEGDFRNSKLKLNDLNSFYNEFGAGQTARFSVDLRGTLNNLSANNLNLRTTRETRIDGDLNFKNLFPTNGQSFELEGKLRNLSSNYKDLTALLPNVLGKSIPSVFVELGNFTMVGESKIIGSNLNANFDLFTEIGFMKTDLVIDRVDVIDEASYVGNVVFEEFNLGEMINDPNVGIITGEVRLDGKGFRFESIQTNVEGEILSFGYNDYIYSDLFLSGELGNYVFNGKLSVEDPNLKLDFNGLADFSEAVRRFDFRANVGYANLKAMNFVTKDSVAEFSGRVNMAALGSGYEDLDGYISVKDVTYLNAVQSYEFDDFEIVSEFRGDNRRITVDSPDIITGEMSGQFKIKELLKLTQNSLGRIYANYTPYEVTPNQHLKFNFSIYNQIAEIIDEKLKIGANTFVKGQIETDEQGFQLELSSPNIVYDGYYVKNLNLQLNNANPVYNTFIEADSVNLAGYKLSNFNLLNVTKRDSLFVKTDFKGGEGSRDQYDLNLYYTIAEDGNSVFGFKKSDLIFKGYEWFINSEKDQNNKITFDKTLSQFEISEIRLNQGSEEMLISGRKEDSLTKTLSLDFKNVELAKITPALDSLELKGRVNGLLNLAQTEGAYLPTSTLEIGEFEVNSFNLGDLRAFIVGDNSLTRYDVQLELENNGIKNVDANGSIEVGTNDPKIDVDLSFRNFLLDPLSPLGEGVISNIRGLVSGDAKVSGSLRKPSIDGELLLDKAGLKIPYLNVDFSFDFDSRVTLEKQRFIFNNVAMTDSKYFSRGFLNGFISHNNFSDWRLGLDLNTDRLLVLDTKESDELYYGTAFVSGKASVNGPTDQLIIDVEATSSPGTVFNIPLKDSESIGDNTYINFLSPEEKKLRVQGNVRNQRKVSGLQLNFNLNLNQNALIEMVMDETSGSTIKGKGFGGLLISINTNGTFRMWGDFSVFEGEYLFRYPPLIEKRFAVDRGSSIVWDGDPLGAEVNIRAIYKTQANPSALLESPISRTIPVELGIDLTGALAKPDLDFVFDFPSVNSTIKSELEYRLSAKEDRDNQGLFLIVTGGFASPENIDFSGTIAERLSGLINGIIGDEDGDLQIGLDLELGQDTPELETESRVGLTLQTNISEKVLLNGKVGVPFGTASQTTITGDVQIDWLLNDDGSLRATVFNRENSIRNFGEEIGFTQGVGLSYNVEFDTFKELMRIIFKGKKKEDLLENTSEDDSKTSSEPAMPDFISLKAKEKNNN